MLPLDIIGIGKALPNNCVASEALDEQLGLSRVNTRADLEPLGVVENVILHKNSTTKINF